MGRCDNLVIWIGIGFFCLIAVFFIFFSSSQRFFSWNKNDVFSENFSYFLSKQGEVIDHFEFNIAEVAFLESKTAPFLIKGEKLAVIETEVESIQNKEIKEYIVKQGDTLIGISQKFNLSIETILWSNNLSLNSSIKPGQKLIVLPVSGVLHLIKPGDSLMSIARFYKTDVEKIIEFNQLDNENDILSGDLLIIPDGKISSQSRISKSAISSQITQIPLADSYFIFPTEGRISQGLHGFFSNAIDISNNCGAPVVAPANGKIERISDTLIGGQGITILHPNGVVTYYGHLSKILVQAGQEVTAAEIIGYIGNTGYTLGPTGCHLHFEVRNAVNFLAKYPLNYQLQWKK